MASNNSPGGIKLKPRWHQIIALGFNLMPPFLNPNIIINPENNVRDFKSHDEQRCCEVGVSLPAKASNESCAPSITFLAPLFHLIPSRHSQPTMESRFLALVFLFLLLQQQYLVCWAAGDTGSSGSRSHIVDDLFPPYEDYDANILDPLHGYGSPYGGFSRATRRRLAALPLMLPDLAVEDDDNNNNNED